MRKHYRSIYFNDERKWKLTCKFDDVYQVGNVKAIGYSSKDLLNNNDFNGKLIMIKGDHLYVGDKHMIQSIADLNKEVLIKSGWTLDAEGIFNNVCNINIDHGSNIDLYHVIADLFNSWCLWCEAPRFKDGIAYSKNPYDPDPNIISTYKDYQKGKP